MDYFDGVVDVPDLHYALTREGRKRHLVRGEPTSSVWPLGADVSPLCGRTVRLTRLAHPSDPPHVCRGCLTAEQRERQKK